MASVIFSLPGGQWVFFSGMEVSFNYRIELSSNVLSLNHNNRDIECCKFAITLGK
jgi:hypothetical protein